jgi:hypothetical protein
MGCKSSVFSCCVEVVRLEALDAAAYAVSVLRTTLCVSRVVNLEDVGPKALATAADVLRELRRLSIFFLSCSQTTTVIFENLEEL